MTPEKQRIATAEACGYKRSETTGAFCKPGCWEVRHYASHWVHASELPDYLNDLNACREMVSVLTTEQKTKYRETLCVLTLGEGGPIDATADQRTEAFLRTIDKWTDG